jgi:hypothetical protein
MYLRGMAETSVFQFMRGPDFTETLGVTLDRHAGCGLTATLRNLLSHLDGRCYTTIALILTLSRPALIASWNKS